MGFRNPKLDSSHYILEKECSSQEFWTEIKDVQSICIGFKGFM